MREWEKRLMEKKKQKVIRIAGRIVEHDQKEERKIDFSPTFMRRLRRKHKEH
ncbi:MAG: hypothetical protein NZ927_06460 [Candidatus Calescibacterium sp.]|nr:hypothetical protein [Candidatus Calescibacterium sp.]MCX7734080.1 hypothetical protein [bacterium]MDW8087078.1 hypothetical protein [Candidatus Calescibacterium sp.]